MVDWLWKFGSLICHQLSDRSLSSLGVQAILCSRCLAIYIGVIVATIAVVIYTSDTVRRDGFYFSMRAVITLIVLMMLLVVDGVTQSIGLRESNNILRTVTGAVFGVCCVFLAASTLFFHKKGSERIGSKDALGMAVLGSTVAFALTWSSLLHPNFVYALSAVAIIGYIWAAVLFLVTMLCGYFKKIER